MGDCACGAGWGIRSLWLLTLDPGTRREQQICTPLGSLTHHGSGGMTTPVSSRDRREDKADAADDEIRWHFVRPKSEQLHRVVELDRTKDESIVFKFREP